MEILNITKELMDDYVVYVQTLKCDTQVNILDPSIKVFAFSGYTAGKKISDPIPVENGAKLWPKVLSFDNFRIKDEERNIKIALVDTSKKFEGSVEIKSEKNSGCYFTFRDGDDYDIYKVLRSVTLSFLYGFNEKNAVNAINIAHSGNIALNKGFLTELKDSNERVSSKMKTSLKAKVDKLRGSSIRLNNIADSIKSAMEEEFKQPVKGVIFSDFNVTLDAADDEEKKTENDAIRAKAHADSQIEIAHTEGKIASVRIDVEGANDQKKAQNKEAVKNIQAEGEVRRDEMAHEAEIKKFLQTPGAKFLLDNPSFRDWLLKMKDQSGGMLSDSCSSDLTKLLQTFCGNVHPKISETSGCEDI